MGLENSRNTTYKLHFENVICFIKMNTFLDRRFLKGIKITPIIKHFLVFKEINEIEEKHNADLIVMGSHGASGAKEVFVDIYLNKLAPTVDRINLFYWAN